VPGLFRQLEAWRAVYGVEPFPADRIRAEQILDITGTKGSLLVWDARLPAGSALNRSPVPRYSMMVTMLPEGDEERRAQRIDDFEAQRAPAWLRDGKSVSENHGPLKLTELGEQLLGRKPW
jgi:ectoine hydroxylase-related dioxygenase (phytanoyl-CoA dioxygenase family)